MKPTKKPRKAQSGKKPHVEQSGTTIKQVVQNRIKHSERLLRFAVVIGSLAGALFLGLGWWEQSHSPLQCEMEFGPLAEKNNGYIQINVVAPHQAEQDFDAEFFLYYSENESPPAALSVTRAASGGYAPSILETHLLPWSKGRATPKPVPFDIPTPGVSLKNFPFDSRAFDFSLGFTPARRPKVVMIRNLTTDFNPVCRTFSSRWDGIDKLDISIVFRRNPFVQTTAVIVGLAALIFGVLLGCLRNRDDLARATASYFFSLWSVRALITPSGLAYSTLLDFWFMAVAVLVLFVVAWRFTGSNGQVSQT